MTFDDRVRALTPWGFTPRQTRFLVTVALHSGFCLRRQYAAFAKVGYGAMVRDFLDALAHRGLARRIAYRRNRGFLYHLHGRGLYRAIGQEDNRNRRVTSPALIARKLMLLDLAISEPHVEWCVTEADKVALFTERYQIAPSDLPRRRYPAAVPETPATTRHFMHKLPIFIAGDPPMPHFVWLDIDGSDQGCSSFLGDHARLLARLPAWTLVAVASAHAPDLTACEQAFRRFCHGSDGVDCGLERADLTWYFGARRAIDRQQFEQVSVADIARFREVHGRVASPSVGLLYQDWLVEGDAVLTSRPHGGSASGIAKGQFAARVLPHTYSQFGDLPGVC